VEYPVSALLVRLDEWIQSGSEPPPSQLLQLVEGPSGQPDFAVDELGNQLGGIQMPRLRAPTGVWSGENANLWCFLNGSYTPFDKAELQELYPSQAAYIEQLSDAIVAANRAGFLLPLHGWEIYYAAKRSGSARRGLRRRDPKAWQEGWLLNTP